MSFEMQSKIDILSRMKDSLTAGQSSVEGTFNSDILAANSIEFEQAYAEMSLMIDANFADTSWGEYLTKRAAEFGVIRKEATKAIGKLLIKGTAGSRIIANSLFATALDTRFYSKTDTVIGADGTILIDIVAVIVGSDSNVEANTIINIPMSIPGVSSCSNPAATYDGFEEEPDKELLERYLLKVRTPATSGNKYHYLQWAREVAGVGNANVLPLWDGPGTVKVIIINSNNQTASSDLINSVAAHIESFRPIGATVTVTSPEPKAINISADIIGTYDLNTVKSNINSYFNQNGFDMTYVSIAHIGKILLDSGIRDYDNLLINGQTENISLTTEELPSCGEVAFNVLP